MYFIDHGASLFFHHNWKVIDQMALKPFYAIKDHILLPWADSIAKVDSHLRARLTELILKQIVEAVPLDWLPKEEEGPTLEGYLTYFQERLAKSKFVEEAERAHTQLI